MELKREQVEALIQQGKKRGLTGKSIIDGLVRKGYQPEGVDVNAVKATFKAPEIPKSSPSIIERVKTGIERKGQKISEQITGEGEFADKSALERGIGATATGFSALSGTLYNSLPEGARNTLDKVGGGIGKGFEYLTDKISNSPFLQEAVSSGDTKQLESALKIASDLGLISGEILLGNQLKNVGGKLDKGITKTTESVTGSKMKSIANETVDRHITSAKQVLSNLPEEQITKNGGVKNLIERAKINIKDQLKTENMESLAQKIDSIDTNLITNIDDFNNVVKEITSKEFGVVNKVKDIFSSPDTINKHFEGTPTTIKQSISDAITRLDPKVKNVLDEVNIEKFDRYVKSGQEALSNPRKLTPLERAGELVESKVLPGIKEDLGRIGAQKAKTLSSINTKQAKGIATESIDYIREKTRALKMTPSERKIVEGVVSELEKLGKNPTIGSADKTVDLLQAMFYEKTRGLTIPVTSRVKSIVNQTIGKFNNSVKNVAKDALKSDEYTVLNDAYSSKVNLFNKLNKALGEEGAKGGSLFKKFFSPQDAGTKKLFAEIKDTYGFDLAEDAVLAKFVMESLGDTRAASLLQGLPLSKASIVNRAIDTAEKYLTDPIGKARRTLQKRGSIPK